MKRNYLFKHYKILKKNKQTMYLNHYLIGWAMNREIAIYTIARPI